MMRRLFFVTLFCISTLWAATPVHLGAKFKSSKQCKTCHSHIVADWQNSWHAKSHFSKDEYFQKSIKMLAKKLRRSTTSIEITCAKCHNPRISVTKVDEEYDAIAALGLDEESAAKKAVEDTTIQEGINCLVCHNIDKIHDKAPQSVRGMDRVEWTQSGMMSGPFKDAKSPYHKTQYRAFFDKDPNKLCFVCHANDHSLKNEKLYFTNMQKEYKGTQKCVECHMSPKHKGYASTYRFKGATLKKRLIRHHRFSGAHTEKMWRNALKLKLKKRKNALYITLINPQPHNIPTGFGGREIRVHVTYYAASGIIKEKTISLTRHYTRRRNKPAIPHLAKKQTKDLSVPAKGERTIRLSLPKEATSVKVTLSYKLANDEIINLLKLTQPIWKKEFFITSKTLTL